MSRPINETDMTALSLRMPSELKEELYAVAFDQGRTLDPDLQPSGVNVSEFFRGVITDHVSTRLSQLGLSGAEVVAEYRQAKFQEASDLVIRLSAELDQ